MTLVVVVYIVSSRSSNEGTFSYTVVALRPVIRSSHIETVVNLDVQNLNLVLDGQISHLDIEAVVVNSFYTGVNGSC